ncbi:hypothetical protein EZV61_04930 [Corallincola luteus]|uniref:PEP-CTERM protein-sorting domain-containing protein n=1 Tax=Corallincola luteus TaxID=1775177 RepID=A0ABY2AQV0_9GAMM|nr:hypothetical protein [Corallincola luteus]TCI05304.1 hypothetical protein EZV61_04930 [Corallincola luteus]
MKKLLLNTVLLASVIAPSVNAAQLSLDLQGGSYVSISQFDGVDYSYDGYAKGLEEFSTEISVGIPTWDYSNKETYYAGWADSNHTSSSSSFGGGALAAQPFTPLSGTLLENNPFAALMSHDSDSIGQYSYFDDYINPSITDSGYVNLSLSWGMSAFGDLVETDLGMEQSYGGYRWDAHITLDQIFSADDVLEYTFDEVLALLWGADGATVSVSESSYYNESLCVAVDEYNLTCNNTYSEDYSTWYEGVVSAQGADVDAPQTIALAMLGLLGFGALRRKTN